MKSFVQLVTFLFLFFLVLMTIGCDEKENAVYPCDDCPGSGQITILLGADTLRYVPGDSASTSVMVIVTSGQGAVMAGQRVSMSLANPALGFIQYQNIYLMDTTDAQGRVMMLYTSVGVSGTDTIFTTTGGISASKPIVVMPVGQPVCDVRFVVSRNVYDPEPPDSLYVEACFSDCSHNAIPGLPAWFGWPGSGGLLHPQLFADSTGCLGSGWISPDDFGSWCVYWIVNAELDSICRTIGP